MSKSSHKKTFEVAKRKKTKFIDPKHLIYLSRMLR